MNIENYINLIVSLPVMQQCFTTKRATWNKSERGNPQLKKLNDKIFGDAETITISRKEIFDTKEPQEKIIKIIYWGYPHGMRGNHFMNIVKQIILISDLLMTLNENTNPTSVEFKELRGELKKIQGLWLSTYSKLLYFFQIHFDKYPCLILDQRLIDTFSRKKYSHFEEINHIRYDNAENKYLQYLKLTHQIAHEIWTKGENIDWVIPFHVR